MVWEMLNVLRHLGEINSAYKWNMEMCSLSDWYRNVTVSCKFDWMSICVEKCWDWLVIGWKVWCRVCYERRKWRIYSVIGLLIRLRFKKRNKSNVWIMGRSWFFEYDVRNGEYIQSFGCENERRVRDFDSGFDLVGSCDSGSEKRRNFSRFQPSWKVQTRTKSNIWILGEILFFEYYVRNGEYIQSFGCENEKRVRDFDSGFYLVGGCDSGSEKRLNFSMFNSREKFRQERKVTSEYSERSYFSIITYEMANIFSHSGVKMRNAYGISIPVFI